MASSTKVPLASTKVVVVQGVSESLFLIVASGIVVIYLAILCALHFGYLHYFGEAKEAHYDFLTSGIVWDHPEPNFTVSPAITEFWSVLTTIPLAGGLLCFLGIRYRLDATIMGIFVGTFAMYNFAFVSHMTIWKPMFQLTLTSVMTNTLSAFLFYGFLAKDLAHIVPVLERLHCWTCRKKVAIPLLALFAFSAVRLPDHLGPGGGVWTLFYVQAPPVWVASLAALSLKLASPQEALQPAYRMVSWAGLFLSFAMAASYVECSLGTDAVMTSTLGGFPVVHLAIHISEQLGIYLYGLSLAFLQHVSVSPRRGAEFEWLLWGTVPYFKCEKGPCLEASDCVADSGKTAGAAKLAIAPKQEPRSKAIAPRTRVSTPRTRKTS